MEYILKHKNVPLCIFNIEDSVNKCIINKRTIEYLPFPIKRAIHMKEEFVVREESSVYQLNEDGCWLIENWLNNREIPSDRENKKKYLQITSSLKSFMLKNHALSLNDCYWVHKIEDKHLKWENVNLYHSDIEVIDIITNYNQEYYKGINATLGGCLEKFWFKDEKDSRLKLCKKTEKTNDILNAREIIANKIYEYLGYPHYCKYEYIYDTKHDIIGCICDCFTNENLELITAYDLLEENNLTQQEDVYELLIQKASQYGCKEEEVRFYLDIQTIVDYLITNRDRHQSNIGFLRDSKTLQLLRPAPIFDSGSSKYLEQQYPENILETKIHGLYATEGELLSYVTSWDKIDFTKLPTSHVILEELNKCKNVTQDRKNDIIKLYNEKVTFLHEVSKQTSPTIFILNSLDEYQYETELD